ncbi:MAG: hypothetical protein H6R19_3187 [Proteobacteria bacterium]|nr:hypothetical protein [Pseudomonadota bacterium]
MHPKLFGAPFEIGRNAAPRKACSILRLQEKVK